MKYIIASTVNNHGGSIVLHNLYKIISNLGYDCYIYEINKISRGSLNPLKRLIKYIILLLSAPFLKKRIGNVKRWTFPFAFKDCVVVYPDALCGNPLHAKNVVRFFLYYDRYLGNKKAYGKNDVFICYRKQFMDNNHEFQNFVLQVPFFDLNLYKRSNFGERRGKCYIVRKGKKRKDLPTFFDGVVVDDLTEEEKVEVFNNCDTCISFDTQTSYSGIAAMCGCLSIVIPEPGKRRSDYLTEDEKRYGVAYGFLENEIKYAQETSQLVYQMYVEMNGKSEEIVVKFIDFCEKRFGMMK